MAEEDVLGLERAELGAGLVVADVEEIAVHHVLEAGGVDAVATVICPARNVLGGGRPGDTSGGGSIVCSGRGSRQWTRR